MNLATANTDRRLILPTTKSSLIVELDVVFELGSGIVPEQTDRRATPPCKGQR